MHDHAAGAVCAVLAPHPDRVVIFTMMTCGCCGLYLVPSHFDQPGAVESWFAVRGGLRQEWGAG